LLVVALLAGCGPVSTPPPDHFLVYLWNDTSHSQAFIVREGDLPGVISTVESRTVAAHSVEAFEFGTAPGRAVEIDVPAGALTFNFANFTFAGGPDKFWVLDVDYPHGYSWNAVPTGAP